MKGVEFVTTARRDLVLASEEAGTNLDSPARFLPVFGIGHVLGKGTRMVGRYSLKVCLVSFICLLSSTIGRGQGIVVGFSFNTNSTEGNYSGLWYCSFNSSNSAPYQGSGSGPNVVVWNVAGSNQTFLDPASHASVNLNFTVGGIGGYPNAFDVMSEINVDDPNFGSIYGGIGDGGGSKYQEITMDFFPGTPQYSSTATNSDSFFFYSWTLSMPGNGSVGLTHNVSFDGTVGMISGTWSVTYPPPVPEPYGVVLVLLGAASFGVSRFFVRRGRLIGGRGDRNAA